MLKRKHKNNIHVIVGKPIISCCFSIVALSFRTSIPLPMHLYARVLSLLYSYVYMYVVITIMLLHLSKCEYHYYATASKQM